MQVKDSLKNFNQSSKGEAIIEVNDDPHKTLGVDNVFAFVRGTKKNFEITRTVRFNAETETEMEIIKETLYERGTWADSYLPYYEREGFATQYSRAGAKSFEQYQQDGRTGSSGQESRETNQDNRGREQYRSGYTNETARIRGSGSPYRKVVHTFTDLTGRKRNVLKIDSEYMIEGDSRSKYQPTIEAAVEAENERIIARYAKKKDKTKSFVRAKLVENPDFLKGFKFSLAPSLETAQGTITPEDTDIAPIGNYNVYGKDLAYIAPIEERDVVDRYVSDNAVDTEVYTTRRAEIKAELPNGKLKIESWKLRLELSESNLFLCLVK